MRLVLPLAALALLAAPAYAQTAPAAVPPPMATAPAAGTTKPAPAVHHRETMDERFAKANATHDGHLTLVQAKAGYPMVAKRFTEIDAAKRGYVTEDDIRAWEKAARARREAAKPPATTPPKG